MMANASKKVPEQAKNIKKSRKAPPKKDAHNPPEHEKVKKKSLKKARPKKDIVPKKDTITKKDVSKKDVHNPLDRIRQMEPQKERNMAQQNNKQPDRTPSQIPQVTKREPVQAGQLRNRSPALERMKKSEVQVPRIQQQNSPATQNRVRNVVPLQLTLRNISVPMPFTYDEIQATSRTTSRAEAHLIEMAQKSRLNAPQAHQHGLSALAVELSQKQISDFKEIGGIVNYDVPAAEPATTDLTDDAQPVITEGQAEPNYLREDRTQIVITEVSESTEPRFITPKQVSLFEDWRPGALKVADKPVSVDREPSVARDQLLQLELEKQQDRCFANKSAIRKKQVRYFRRLEGVGRDAGDANITPSYKADRQSIANFPIIEDVEESARGYAEFLYRPGAAWKNLGSYSASLRSFGPSETDSRPKSCEARKSTNDIVFAISSASARREAMRKELAERLRDDTLRKKLLVAQNRAASRHPPCRCC